MFQPDRDDDLAFRFGHDPGVGAMLYLAIAVWPMGELSRSLVLVERARTRIAGVAHVGTKAYAAMHAAMFELMRGDVARVRANATELARLAEEHDLSLWRAFAVLLEGWLAADRGEPASTLARIRRGFELLAKQNAFIMFGPLVRLAQAEAEETIGGADRAMVVMDEALATAEQAGHRAFVAELHRARGDLLLRGDPANPALAEEAYRSAVAIAREQGSRAFGLRAALALAKLYQSTSRPVEGHDVLAPALEGFSPTPEMPEIAEAQTLLAALAPGKPAELGACRTQTVSH